MHDPGLGVVSLESFKCRFRPPPTLLNCLNCQDRPMEDDSDTEMADYGTDFSDDVDRNFDALAGSDFRY